MKFRKKSLNGISSSHYKVKLREHISKQIIALNQSINRTMDQPNSSLQVVCKFFRLGIEDPFTCFDHSRRKTMDKLIEASSANPRMKEQPYLSALSCQLKRSSISLLADESCREVYLLMHCMCNPASWSRVVKAVRSTVLNFSRNFWTTINSSMLMGADNRCRVIAP